MSKRIFITGATGFIGRYCLKLLKDCSFEIHAVTRQDQYDNEIFWHKCNLLEKGTALRLIRSLRPSYLLHLAWNAEPNIFWTTPENLDWIGASLELLQAFAEYGGRRVVITGTCAEYDWRFGFCSEDITPLLPDTLYGTCKNALQDILTSYSQEAGISSAWGRIFFIFGPHENPGRLISSVTLSLLKGQTAACSHGNQVRDFLHVADVASAIITLLTSDFQGPINIASGRGITVKEIVINIGTVLGRLDLIQFGEVPTSPTEPPLLIADTRRLNNELGWQPSETFEQRIKETINWWKVQYPSSIDANST